MTEEERKARHRESNKRWYEKNKERCKANAKRWHTENRDHKKELMKAWYEENRASALANQRVYNRANRYNYLDTDHYKWEDVEGYDGWTINTEVHHRREGIGYSVAQLKEQGQYYGCRADELICVTHAEHSRIHQEIDKFFHRGNYKD